MKQKIAYSIIIISIMILSSCKTTTTLGSKVSLGMTKQQIIETCGNPYKTSQKYDSSDNLIEVLFYKEKTWDDGGWSWSTTVTNHMLILKNNKLVAIEQGDEEHNKQQYNTILHY